MRIKSSLLILLLISFFSCDKTEEKITEEPIVDDSMEEPVVVDEENPELTVNGFTDILETFTTISVSIVDDSTVETKVFHNEEEIAASTEKQFEVSLNPYVIPVGSTEFVIVSTDVKGNETSETYSVEIKHLLMTFGRNDPGQTIFTEWLFFNDLEGKELAVLEQTPGDTKIYTDEIILEDAILYSKVSYSVTSFKTLYLATYKIDVGKTKVRPTGVLTTPINNTVEVKLNDVPLYSYGPDYYASGYKYYVSSYSGTAQQTTLTIKHNAQPICIRPNRWSGSAPIFDGKKENYKHIFITPEAGDTIMEIAADQLLPAENNIKLNIPEQDPGTLSFRRNGYMSSSDLNANRRIEIYNKFSGNETEMVDYIDLPLFSMFTDYYNELSYARKGYYYYTNGTDEDLDATMPDWTASLQITDSSFDLTSANPDVDYYEIELNKKLKVGNTTNQVTWRFNAFSEGENVKTLPRIEIPEMITDFIGDTYFETTDDLEVRYIHAVDYAKYNSYKETINWLAFDENPPNYSDNKKREVLIPDSNNSDKSISKDKPWNLDAHHHYGLDEKGEVKNGW